MNLYILRHGDAEATAVSDAERQLTERGRLETKKVLDWLKNKKCSVDVIISSPYIRARQTAMIAAEALNLTHSVNFSDALTPDKTPEDVLGALNDLTQSNVLVVGHLPLLGCLLSALVSGDDQREVSLKKSGLAFIQIPELKFASGNLQWMVTPDIL